MEDTHTTVVVERDKWIEIITLHDQSGSAAIGLVPIENIPMLIEGLKKFIGFNPVLADSSSSSNKKELDGILLDGIKLKWTKGK